MHSLTKKVLLLCCALIGLQSAATAQLFTDNFDADIASWTAVGAWDWDDDGKADTNPDVNWENRSRLRSRFEGGAALFASNDPDGQLISPVLNSSGTSDLFVSFYQYLRVQTGRARLQVLDAGGAVVLDRALSDGLNVGEESSAGNFQIIDISELNALNITQFSVQLDVDGELEFWLVDEFEVTTNRPAWPSFPFYFGRDLTDFGVPFTVDSAAMPFVPFEVVIDFADDATDLERQAVLDALKPEEVQSCVCSRIEVYRLPGGTFFDPVSGQPLGDPGDILERVLGAGLGDDGGVDNIEFNFYSYNQLEPNTPIVSESLTAGDLAFLQPAPANVTKVAILDTGFDLDHPGLTPYLYRNDDVLGDNTDSDDNCYVDDLIGWNFVDNNNNPVDDHGHGSHVAGIVAQGVEDCSTCTIQLIPYKTHNSFGVGTLFASACATLQASVNDEVQVINASWGFYGTGSDILQAAIDTANSRGTVVVAAAGNDSLNLVADQQFPATYAVENVFSVGAVVENGTLEPTRADFSNYNPEFVKILANGSDITSTVPDNEMESKSGTSMSTPAVSAFIAVDACAAPGSPAELIDRAFTSAAKNSFALGEFVDEGTFLSGGVPCPADDDVSDQVIAEVTACICTPDEPNVITFQSEEAELVVDIRVLTQAGASVISVEAATFDAEGQYNLDVGEVEPGILLLVVSRDEANKVLRITKQ